MMKKTILFLLFFSFLPLSSFGQISGDIVNDHRQLLTNPDYLIKGPREGMFMMQIAVNTDGKVTSVEVIDSLSSIHYIPAEVVALHYVSTAFKFEKGLWYPKYHQGKVLITMEKKE